MNKELLTLINDDLQNSLEFSKNPSRNKFMITLVAHIKRLIEGGDIQFKKDFISSINHIRKHDSLHLEKSVLSYAYVYSHKINKEDSSEEYWENSNNVKELFNLMSKTFQNKLVVKGNA